MLQHLDDLMVFSCFKGEAEINEEESSVVSRGFPGVVADSGKETAPQFLLGCSVGVCRNDMSCCGWGNTVSP